MLMPSLPARGDSEGFHFPVKMAALQAEGFGGAGDVALVFLQLAQDIIALVSGAGFLQEEKPVTGVWVESERAWS